MKAFVLLSGGIDSSTCLGLAVLHYGNMNVTAISVNYKQRHIKELACAKDVVEHFKVWDHRIIVGPQDLNSMLNDANQEIPDVTYDEIEGVSPTYVPFRNGQLLSLIAAQAHMEVMDDKDELAVIYFGAHAEDAANWAYPDCTPEFVGAMANAIYVGTYHQVRLEAPFQYQKKSAIIKEGHFALDVPYELTWSCYKGEELHCGACPTCYARHQAFIDADVTDPTKYAKDPIRA